MYSDNAKLEEGDGVPFLTQGHKRSKRINLAWVVTSVIATVVVIAVFSIDKTVISRLRYPSVQVPWYMLSGYQIYTDDTFGPYITCPTDLNPALTRSAGCSFDLLANGWVPDPCFDTEMHRDFVDGKDYGFFEDRHGKVRVHQHTILEGDIARWPDGLFLEWNEHYEHCRYIMNGSIRAAQPPFTGFLDLFHDEEHLQHCVDFLGDKQEPTLIDPEIKAIFKVHRCYLGLM